MNARSKQPQGGRLMGIGLMLAAFGGSAPVFGQACPGGACGPGPLNGPPPAWDGKNACPKMPLGAIPRPNGSFVREWQAREVTRAAADQYVIYKHEWFMGGMDLGPYGRYHLDRIAHLMANVPFPVVLQPELRDDVNELRRQLVIKYLVEHGNPDAPQRVLVAYPAAEGLFGEEAPRVFLRGIQGTGRGVGGGGGVGVGAFPGSTGTLGGAGSSLGLSSR